MQDDIDDNQVKLEDAQTILDSITDAFFTLNRNWEFSYVNRQTQEVLGHHASELLNRSIWDVFPGTVGSEFERAYRKAAHERIALSFNAYYPDHDRWYDVNVYPAQGGLSIYFRNITARMKDDMRRHALFTLSDTLRDLTCVNDITFKAADILGQTLAVSRVGYGTIDATADTLHVTQEWNRPGVTPLAQQLDLRDYGSFIDDLKAGKFVVIDDVDHDHRTAPAAAALKARCAGSFVNVPILEQGRLVAVLYVNHATARHWSNEELAFIKEVAQRTRTASEHQRSEDALTKLVGYSERRRRLYETFLENTPDLAYVFDLQHRFTYANKVLLTMWNRTWDEAIGKNCLELGYEPWHAEMHDREIEQVILTRQSVRGEVPFNGAYGRRIYEYIFVPVLGPDGEVEAIAGTTRDVTDRKHEEEAMADANQRKDEFLAMLAHELRNPLAPISAAAEVLDRFASNDQLTKKTSRIIIRQVKHMTALVDDLLDVSRVTRGLVELKKAPLDLDTVVYHAVEQVRPFIEAQRHHLQLNLGVQPGLVLGDQKRLVQIVSNLLNNAAKYTPAGGAIEIKIVADATTLALTVTDNGIGIAPALQPRVFDLFTQAERTSDRTQGGLGIGLALAKNLTEMHGGTIHCISSGQGRGSAFTVVLPRYHEPARTTPTQDQPEAASGTAPSAPATSLRVQVVDDNADAATMLGLYLEAVGHQVFIEHSSLQALACARREQPDVCILDIGLPDMDGNQLARQLKADARSANACLIAVTGYGHESDKAAAKAAGFDGFFVKPLDAAALVDLLRQKQVEAVAPGLSDPYRR